MRKRIGHPLKKIGENFLNVPPIFSKGWPVRFFIKLGVLQDKIKKFQFARITADPQWFPLTSESSWPPTPMGSST